MVRGPWGDRRTRAVLVPVGFSRVVSGLSPRTRPHVVVDHHSRTTILGWIPSLPG